MNQIRAIQALNKRELEQGISPAASWHADYRDTAFIFFGGLPLELSEGDVLTVFSQFGEPVWLKLARDRDSGKSRGFGWLKYEDQRSTDLAVDNLGGAEIGGGGGRLIRVDHARYKPRDDEDMEASRVGWEDMARREASAANGGNAEGGGGDDDDDDDDEGKQQRRQRLEDISRPLIKEERELQLLIENQDDDDPMKEFLIEEKRKEVEEALAKEKRRAGHRDGNSNRRHHHHHHRHHRSHRSRRGDEDDGGGDGSDRERGAARDRDRYRDRDRDDYADPDRRRDHKRARKDGPGGTGDPKYSDRQRSERRSRSRS